MHTINKKKILDADAYVNSLIVERSSRAKITAERIQFSFLNYLLAGRWKVYTLGYLIISEICLYFLRIHPKNEEVFA